MKRTKTGGHSDGVATVGTAITGVTGATITTIRLEVVTTGALCGLASSRRSRPMTRDPQGVVNVEEDLARDLHRSIQRSMPRLMITDTRTISRTISITGTMLAVTVATAESQVTVPTAITFMMAVISIRMTLLSVCPSSFAPPRVETKMTGPILQDSVVTLPLVQASLVPATEGS